MDKRASWKVYFLNIAKAVATRSTCDRLHVGCVITRNKHILTTGCNGALPGEAHCDDVGHLMLNCHCKRTVHAEVNAVAQAALEGISLRDSIAYLTHSPCLDCFKVLVTAGVKEIWFSKAYGINEKSLSPYHHVASWWTFYPKFWCRRLCV
jgi:dCMP deaminase